MTMPDAPLLLSEQVQDPQAVENRPDILLGAALVPSSQCLEVALPHAPTGRHDLLRMLLAQAPVLPQHLVWTSPIAESVNGAKITVVRREWLDRFVGDLERELGHMLEARTARDHLLFRYVSPASRRARSITLSAWIAGLIVAGIAALAIPDRGQKLDTPTAIGESVVSQNSEFAQIGILAAIAGQPFGKLPDGLIAGISGNRDGGLLVILNTQDPDALRDLLTERRLLVGYRQLDQTRSRDGGYLVTYSLNEPSVAQPAILTSDRIPILRARDAAVAIAVTERTLIAYTAEQGLQLGLIAPAANGEAKLEFDIELAGPQERVFAAVNAIESGSPPMQFGKWELKPDRAEMRLTATLIVPWAHVK